MMMKTPEPENPDVDRPDTEAPDRQAPPRTGEGSTDMRKANENIRKSQGDDVGQPTIDRHR
jgi:hypothetical protein